MQIFEELRGVDARATAAAGAWKSGLAVDAGKVEIDDGLKLPFVAALRRGDVTCEQCRQAQ
jgi:hypothetical protein